VKLVGSRVIGVTSVDFGVELGTLSAKATFVYTTKQ